MAQTRLTGAPCWIDLSTSDPDQAQAFYGGLFGWDCEVGPPEYGGYLMFSKAGQPVAGGMKNDGSPSAPNGWMVYLSATDTAATVDAAAAHGGTVLTPPMEVPGQGTMAILADAGGAAVGVWQAGPFAGFTAVGDPGMPSWFELHTRDYDASVGFYRDVFGWETHVTSDTEDFRYTTLGEGASQQAGVIDATSFLAEGAGASWQVYFGVTDADATVQKATELGGTVVEPVQDTPYGRIATLTDSTGGRFRIVQAPAR